MSEITALSKFNCPACGAEAVWTPSKHALVCPYCGTISPAELKADGTLVEENDLVAALRSLPEDQRGWAAAKKTVRCQACNAVSVFDEKRMAQNCDFCGSPAIVAVEDTGAPIRPSSVLPFKVADTKVREDIRRWYGSHWFAPNKLKSKALTDTLHGVYLPYWTFDAHANCPWTPRPATTTTRATARASRSATRAGCPRQAWCSTSSTMCWCSPRKAFIPIFSPNSNPSPRRRDPCLTIPAMCQDGWSSSIRSTSSRPPRIPAPG